jgi:Tol biopolymer transport system component
MNDDDELKRRFEEESSRVEIPSIDPKDLASRATRRRRLRAGTQAAALCLAVIGSLVLVRIIDPDAGRVELVQPATGSGFGGPAGGSPIPTAAPSAKPSSLGTGPSSGPTPMATENRSDPAISGDGRFVAFAAGEVYVFDRQADKRELVSVTGSGKRIEAGKPQISQDGRFVAFVGRNGIVYVRDRTAKTTSAVSVSTGGEAVAAGMPEPSISMSGDGRYVTFSATAAALVEGDTNGVEDVYVHDRLDGKTTRVSVSSTGEQANGRSAFPDISSDGRFVAFMSYSSNLDSGAHPKCGTAACPQGYVHDRDSGKTSLVSISSSGEVADKGARHPSISADGRAVAFDSVSTNLAASMPDGAAHDIFVRDLGTGETRELSGDHDCNCVFPSISNDGSSVAYGTSTLGLRVYDVKTGSERRVGTYGGGSITFVGDGRVITYSNSQRRIVVLNVDNGNAETLP